jgi:hypothetical protein
MEVALVEQPVGDRYLNEELWSLADEQFVPLARKATLNDNGWRVGLISGVTPADLQALLTSERSCPDPRCRLLYSGSVATLDLGPVLKECRYQSPGEGELVEFPQAVFQLEVRPTVTEEGHLRLHIVPKVAHQSSTSEPHWVTMNRLRRQDKASENCDPLSWDVDLDPNQLLVVGGQADRANSMGCQCFVRRGEIPPVQRLLVLRTTLVRTTEGSLSADPVERAALQRMPPLALQAASGPACRPRE